jgi:bifunctional UDP-N-acetylglucosamine pyrophosphorylase/glucosamine-1-phosphate N-acetyltransferase
MAAGEGTRLRPLTARWPKPVLPIDGRPVVVTLVHELAAAGCAPVVVVTGHLREQVERLLAPLPYELRFVVQPAPLGSADAVARSELAPPYVVCGADTKFRDGDVARFVVEAAGTDGAVAVRRQQGRPEHTRIRVDEGRVLRIGEADAPGEWTGAPLWYVGGRVGERLLPLPGRPPHELGDVFQLAIDAGASVSAIQVGRTRDLTSPVDLVRENFPYLLA